MKNFVKLTKLSIIALLLQACETPQQSTPPFPSPSPPTKPSPPLPPSQPKSPSEESSPASKPSQKGSSSEAPDSRPQPRSDGEGLGSPQPTWETGEPRYGSTGEKKRKQPTRDGGQDSQIPNDKRRVSSRNGEFEKEASHPSEKSPDKKAQQDPANSGEWDPLIPRGERASNSSESELEKELNDSLIIFENEILEARAEVIGSAPPPTSSANIPGIADLSGDVTDRTKASEEDTDPMTVDRPNPKVEQSSVPENTELASANNGPRRLIPDDIPDPQGDDIVAQQLREAAVAETDPDLRAKLWEEYRRYRASL